MARADRARQFIDRYRIDPGSRVRLRDLDAGETKLIPGGKKKGEELLAELGPRLNELQDLLYAGHDHKLLIVLQGMDTSGKDGAIRKVFQNIDPLGVRAVAFRAPSEEERDHDFLWRVHRQVPGAGEVVVFNRSHYEDVLVVRVHQLVPMKVWSARFDQINDFEKMLVETGTTILKFYLHIDRKEQRKRLQERLDDPAKQWKFRRGDLEDRKRWDDYEKAYQDVLARTSTKRAPWFVVPANAKWYRNVIVAQVLVDALESLDLKPPRPPEELKGLQID